MAWCRPTQGLIIDSSHLTWQARVSLLLRLHAFFFKKEREKERGSHDLSKLSIRSHFVIPTSCSQGLATLSLFRSWYVYNIYPTMVAAHQHVLGRWYRMSSPHSTNILWLTMHSLFIRCCKTAGLHFLWCSSDLQTLSNRNCAIGNWRSALLFPIRVFVYVESASICRCDDHRGGRAQRAATAAACHQGRRFYQPYCWRLSRILSGMWKCVWTASQYAIEQNELVSMCEVREPLKANW